MTTHTSGQQHCPGPHDHCVQCWNAGWEAREGEHPAEDGGVTELLVELRAIRALLERQDAEQARCPHGARGLCMDCVTPLIDYHLTQMVQNVGNTIWEATRRG